MHVRLVGVTAAATLMLILGSGCNPDKNKLIFKPTPAAKLTVDTEEVYNLSMTAMGMSMGIGSSSENTFEMTAQTVDPAGVATIQAVIKSMEVDITGMEAMMGGGLPGIQAGIEKNDDPIGMKAMKEALKAAKDQSFTVKVDRFGKVLEVTGADEIAAKVAEAYKQPKGLPPMPARSMFREIIGDKPMKEIMDSIFVSRPDLKLTNGKTWQGTFVRSNNATETAHDVTFTVRDRANGVVNIDTVAKVDVKPNAGLFAGAGPMADNIKFEVNGQGTGTLQIDEATGWVKDWSGSGTMPGNISVQVPEMGNMSMPIEISYKTSIKSFPS